MNAPWEQQGPWHREAAAYLNAYARRFSAGAWATPTAAELVRMYRLAAWPDEGDLEMVVAWRQLARESRRHDWTGAPFTLNAGAEHAAFVARSQGAPVPNLDRYDWITTHVEDQELSAALTAQGREPYATQITAASELLTTWGWVGCARPHLSWDGATALRLGEVNPPTLDAMLAELALCEGWADDYPYYSDGSWSGLSLRGFDPSDPAWGAKPSELGKTWNEAHPGALDRSVGWTPLADLCPTMRRVAESMPQAGLERVRLMRMAAKPGGGKLRRHTDITDKAAGLRDGQVARIHVPLVTHPDVVMHVWELDGTERQVHLGPGEAWYLDARKPHAVTNPSPIDRVHLVIDLVVGPAVRDAITKELSCSAAT